MLVEPPTTEGALMSTLTVQDVAPVGSEPLARDRLELPDAAVTVPPQVLTTLGTAATVCPAGKASENDRPVNSGALLACVSVTVIVVSLFTPTEAGL